MFKVMRYYVNKVINPVDFCVMLFILATCLSVPSLTIAEDDPCLKCHKSIAGEKTVHEALSEGCTSCHSELDTGKVPHKVTGKNSKGLSTKEPDICYECHDAPAFGQKVVHEALEEGCTGCHNPHSSKNSKLLSSPAPELCYECHDKFEGTLVHGPVSEGECLECHTPHSGSRAKLLIHDPPDLCFTCHERETFKGRIVHSPVTKGKCMSCHAAHAGKKSLLPGSPNAVCHNCHADQANGKHVLAGFPGGSHPVDGEDDPSNPGEKMSCLSCHFPHSSDFANLLIVRSVCSKCHKY